MSATTAILLGVCACGGLLWVFILRLGRHPDEPSPPRSDNSRRWGTVIFRTCPDCRELVYRDASACKFCGCALLDAAITPPPSPAPAASPDSTPTRN